MAQVTVASSARRRVEGYVGATNGNDQPLSVVVANAASKLVAMVASSVAPTALTRNGQSFTFVDVASVGDDTYSSKLQLYVLNNPSVGTYDVVLSRTAQDIDLLMEVHVIEVADVSTLYAALVKGAISYQPTPTVTAAVTVPTDGIVIAGFAMRDIAITYGGPTVAAVSPSVLAGQQDALAHQFSLYKAASGSATQSFTYAGGASVNSAYVALAIGPAAGGDTTAPVLSSPTGVQTGSSYATLGATTDEANGTLYAYASTNSTETAATIKASGTTQTVSSTGAKTIGVTGLTPSTLYYGHLVHRDAAGNDSNVVNSASFTTAASGGGAVSKILQLLGT